MHEPYAVRAFGRLEVERADGSVALGGPRPRTVLAVLLVVGRRVSTDRLVEETWGEDPPAGARRTLQAYVAGLRRSLGGDDGPLRSERGGYRIDRERIDLDLARFEALAHEGRERLATGDVAAGEAILEEALELWIDEPFADLPVDDIPTLSIERTRLSELRMNVVEAHLGARLALGRASEAVPELERLVAIHPEREGLWRHLMVALHESGRSAEALRAAERCRLFLGGELGLDPGEDIRRLEQRIAARDALIGHRDDADAEARTSVCPYKGLAMYLPDDAALYFGRDRVVDRLVARLAERPLVAVVGPSGTGKSSLVRAGLIPALRAGALPGPPWEVTIATPGADPPAGIPSAGPGRRCLLILDQFEELFTRCTRPKDRERFLDRLADVVSDTDAAVRVVVVARADFYGRFAESTRFAALVSEGTLLVGPMSAAELERAVTGPARHVGLTVDPALVDAVVNDAGNEPGALPLVSHALVETWARREGRALTLAGYLQAGGVVGALAQSAEGTVSGRLSPGQQLVARDVLLRLVEPAEEGPDTRRTVDLDELVGAASSPTEARAVIEVLTEARLLSVDEDGVRLTHEALIREWPRLRAWLDTERQGLLVRRRLNEDARRWDRDGRDPADLLRGVRLAGVTDWREHTGLPLNDLEADFLDASIALADRQQREAEERATQQARSNRRLRLMVAVVLVAFLAAAALGVVALRQRQRAEASAEAATARQLASQVDALRGTDLDLALLLAAEAVAFADRAETRRVLLETLHEEPSMRRLVPIGDATWSQVAISPDGGTLVTLGDDERSVTIVSLEDGRPVGPPHVLPRAGPSRLGLGPSLAVSDGGGLAAVQQPDGTVHVFDGETGRPVGTPVAHGIGGGAVAFGPDGAWLAIMSVTGPPGLFSSDEPVPTAGIVFVDPATGAHVAPEVVVDEFLPIALSVAPDGQTLAAIDRFADAVAVWSWPDGALLSRFFGPQRSVAVTLDGHRVAVVGEDSSSVHDARSGRRVAGPLHLPAPGASVAFASGGRLVTGSSDGWRTWDLDAPRQEGAAVTGAGGVDLIRVVNDEDIVTVNRNGRAVLWSLGNLPAIGRRLPVPFAGSFAPDTSRLVTADPARPGSVALYRLEPVREVWRISLGSAASHAERFAWAPDGGRIAAVTRAGELVVLSAVDGAVVTGPVTLPSLADDGVDSTAGERDRVEAAVYSSDGGLLAIGTAHGQLLVIDPDTGRSRRAPLDVGIPIRALLFDATERALAGGDGGVVLRVELGSGRTEDVLRTGGTGAVHVLATAGGGQLVVAGDDGLLSIWSRDGGSLLAQMDAGPAAVRGVALSPDGRWLAASLETGETALFDVMEGTPAGTLGVASSTVAWPHPLAFSPIGTRLYAWDNTSYVAWTFDAVAWQELACTIAGRSLTEAERARFLADLPRSDPCRTDVTPA